MKFPEIQIHRVVDFGISRSALERKHPHMDSILRVHLNVLAYAFVPSSGLVHGVEVETD